MENFQYHIYGLQVLSTRKISVLRETGGFPADISLEWVTENAALPFHDLNWENVITPGIEVRKVVSFYTAQTPNGIFYKVSYQIRHGELSFLMNAQKDRVWVCAGETIPSIDVDSFFVGSLMGAILRLRDTMCLHASVIAVGGKAIAFLGSKKSGKSTIAAEFVRLGYQVLADDMAVIRAEGDSFYIQPGYPQLRLRAQTLALMYPGTAAALPVVRSGNDTRYAAIPDSFCKEPLPLAAVFIMSPAETGASEASVVQLGLPESMIQLGKNTFADYVIMPGTRKTEFELLGRLATSMPVSRLRVVYDITKVARQCQVVLNTIDQLITQLN
ncbi:MAG: hypothetical protein ACXVJD_16265 [Mucilaginibacter sp.]